MKKHGHKFRPWAHHVSGWVTAGVMVEALARMGSPGDRSALMKALEKTNFDTKGLMGGAIQFTPTDHYGLTYTMGAKWDPIKKGWSKATDWIKIDPKEIAKLSP
jgi:ABC-type branched-subunit amino acid transport system substrate-binding protein